MSGHDSISEVSIASRFASLKSDHRSEDSGRVHLDGVGGELLELLLEVGGDPHHLVGVHAGAREHHGGPPVLGEACPRHRRNHLGQARLVFQDGGDLGEDGGASPWVSGLSVLCTTTWIAWLAFPPK